MKKVYEASTPGFSRVMSNVAQFFSGRTMSALPRVAALVCLSFIGANSVHAQACNGVSCDISFANLPSPMPPVGSPAQITMCLNAQGTGQITSQLMAGYTSSSNGTCCTIVRVWENAAATNPLVPADPDYDVDCTDIGRNILVWVTRETNVAPINGGPGRSAPLPFAIYIADCTPPNITCPAPQTLTCSSDYTSSLPPNPMTYAQFNALGGGALVTDNADACGPTGFEVSYTDVFSNLVCLNGFTVTRTYVAKDNTGNTKSCTQVITVSDKTPPFFTTLPQNLTLDCPRINAGTLNYFGDVLAIQTAIQNWLNNYGGGAVADLCPGGFTQNVVLCVLGQGVIGCQTTSPATGLGVWNQMPEACSPQPREVQVGFFVTDACGNEAFAVAKVILRDVVNPTITALPAIAASYTCETLVPVPNPQAVVANDNCTGTTPPGPNYAQLVREWVSDVPTPILGGCGNRTITRTYRVTDCAGNSTTSAQVITVNDNVNPVWGPAPTGLSLSCSDPNLSATIAAWLANKGGAAATDNCNGVTITANYASAAAILAAMPAWCPGPGNTRFVDVTFQAVDGCSNSISRMVRVEIYDFTPPTSNSIPSASAKCLPSEVPVNTAVVTGVADNCTAAADVVVSYIGDQLVSAGNGCVSSPRVFNRTYRLTDCAGNTANVNQLIFVADDVAPTWTTNPSPLNLSCPATSAGNTTSIQNWLNSQGTTGVASDNCGTTNFRTIPATVAEIQALLGPCAPLAGSVTVTFVVEDACGNSSTRTALLTVTDNVAPTAGNPAVISLKCISQIPAPNIAVVPTVADVCSPAGSITVKYERDSSAGVMPGCPGVGNDYRYFHIYSIKDCSGNWIERVQRFNIVDDVDPNANCKAVTVQLGANGVVNVCASQFNDGSADNCTGTLTYEFARDIINDGINFAYGPYTTCKDFTCDDIVNIATCASNVSNEGEIAIRMRVIDACGNVSGYCTTNITVQDLINPTITCPDDRMVLMSNEGDYDCQVSVEIVHPTPADNCTVVCYEMEVQKEIDGVLVTIDPATGAPAPNYRQDVIAGDMVTYIFEKGPYCGINGNGDTRMDDDYKIIYYVRDEHGNNVSCDYTITVKDDLAPVFTFCPDQPIIEAQSTAGDCYQFKCWAPPTYFDNCQFPYFGEGSGYCPIPTLVVTTSDPSVMVDTIGDDHCALFPVGQTEVYYTVTDFCGNSATCTVTVIISDIEAPMAMCVGNYSVNLQPNGLLELTYADIDAGSSDNCGLCSKEIGRVYTPGGPVLFGPTVQLTCADVANSPIQITLRVKDCGQPIQNEDECTVLVTVLDMQSPGIATCPADIVVCTDANACTAVVNSSDGYFIPTFNDGCGSQHPGTLQVGLAPGSTFPIGETLVAYDYTSASGFNVVCEFNVTVEDCEVPAMVCPPNVTLTCLEALCCPEDFTGGTLTDNCGVTLLQSSDFDNGLSHCTYDGIRTIIRTYTAWDAAGNTSTCARTYVYTEDTEVPVLTYKPASYSVDCASEVLAPEAQSATDNCGTVNIDFSEVVEDNVCVNQQVIVRTWIATDLCGNQTNWVQTITVNDSDAPTFDNKPADYASDCSEGVLAVVAPDVDDNCDVFTVEFSEAVVPGGCEDKFVVTRTWVATDICGNASTYVQTVTINDNINPVIANVPAGYDVQCAEGVLPIAPTQMPLITDNCVQVNVDFSESVIPGGCEDKFTVVRRWVATDACGNRSVAFQIINVNDNTKPVFDPQTLPDERVVVACAQDVPAVAAVTVSDNCGEPLTIDFVEVEVPGDCDNQYQIIRTWTAEDDCGNNTSFVQTINVFDGIAPTFSDGPKDYSSDCSEDVPAVDAPDIDDNCDVFTVDFSETVAPGGCEDQFVVTRTWVATDICGNASTYVQTITIEDDIAPVFTNVPPSDVVSCSENVPAVVTPGVSDNCSQVVVDFSETVLSNGCEDKYTVTRTWIATDLCGNQAMTFQVIQVNDVTAPVLAGLPNATVLVACAQEVPAVANVTATDNCAEPIEVIFNEVEIPGTCHDQYQVRRTWTAEDDCGNRTSFVQLITVKDSIAPVMSGLPTMATVPVACAEAVPAVPVVSATDNCGQPIDVDFSEVEIPGTCPNQYSITRTWRATDDCGNFSVFTQTINISDVIAPVMSGLPTMATVSVECAEAVPAVPVVTATDNCVKPIYVDFSEVEIPGTCPNQYSITRTWRATDDCGNFSVFTQTINISDVIAPVMSGLPTMATVSVECAEAVPAVPVVTATDNCVKPIDVDFSEVEIPGTCPNQYSIKRTWRATDDCGNFSVFTQTINISDVIAPVMSGLPTMTTVSVACAEAVPAVPVVTATDNCVKPIDVDFSEVEIPGTCPNQYSITRTWRATDDCGNFSVFTQTINISDVIAPVMSGLPVATVNVDCADDVPAVPVVTATDNCIKPIDVDFSEVEIPGICVNQYVITRTWRAQDDCGNFSVFTQTITIHDDEAPELFAKPIRRHYQCIEQVEEAPFQFATDNCDVATIDFYETENPGNCPSSVIIVRRWTAWDLCGNSSEWEQEIHVLDTIAPVFLVTPVDRTYECLDDVANAPDQGTMATDNCGPVFVDFMETRDNDSCHNQVIIIRRWEATDLCGNKNTHWQYITVYDDKAPVLLVTPTDRTYECLSDVDPAPDQTPFATDNCGVFSVDFFETRGDENCQNQVQIIRRWEATDLCGNKATHWQYITVYDDVPPVLPTTPQDRTYECVEDVETAPIQVPTDNCDIVTVDFAEFTNPGDCPSQVVINRRWIATDLCGNTTEHWQVITVNDTKAPVLSATPISIAVACTEDVPAAPIVTATDNCDIVFVDFSESTEPGTCLNQYIVTRHWEATDLCGNKTEHYQTITVNDNVKPTWTSALPANVTVQCGEDVQPATLTATDNCGAPLVNEFNETLLPGAGPNDAAKLTRTWTVTDACGNSIQHTQVVTINDTQAPVLTNLPAATVNVSCSQNVPAVANVSFTDNCQGTVDFFFSEVEVPGTCANQYQVVRTWRATDFAGNSAVFVQTITVSDVTAPTLIGLPAATVNVSCSQAVPAVPNVTASDNCGAPIVLQFSEVEIPGTCSNQYVITRTWSAQDDCGNATSFVQTITVSDVTAPTLVGLPAATVNVSCSQDVPVVANVTATDNCGAPIVLQFSEVEIPGTCSNQYVITRTWSAQDDCGNATSFVQTITISDTQAPTLVGLPAATVNVSCSQNVPAVANVTASDNCGAPIVLQFSEVEIPGTCSNQYVITRTWSAQDDCGNATSFVQTITISDTQAPTLVGLPAATVSVECSEQVPAVANVTATDNCGAPIVLQFSEVEIPGTCPNQYQITRTWSAQDDCGNATSFVQTITINDTKAPQWDNVVPVVWVNEIHYDNSGTDTGEFIEVAGTAGVDLSNYSLVLYNGATPANGLVYSTRGLSGIIPNQSNGFGTLSFSYPVDGIQNGPSDGVALVRNNTMVLQYLSYEGSVTAVDGPAAGMTSTNIGVEEGSATPIGFSVNLIGTGNSYANFAWSGPSAATPGTLNIGQTMTAPAGFALPADVTVQCGENVPMPMVLKATDNCNAPVDVEYSEVFVPAAGPNDGMSIIRTWTAEDDCGNSIAHTQRVTINDTQKPVLGNLPPAVVNVVCAENVPAIAPVTYSDNCQGTVTFDFSESILPGNCAHRFTLTRTWTATDFAGNSTQFVQTINVNDNVAPTWTSALPANVTVECGEQVQPATLTASDNCSGTVLIEFSETLLPGAGPNDGGILTRTWTAYDVCGNSIKHIQTVTINDTQAPVLVNLPAATVNVSCSQNVPAVANVTFTDNCQGTVDFFFSEVEVPGTCANQYQVVRTWRATDFAGNSAVFVQTITVSDVTAPTLVGLPAATVNVSCSQNVPVVANVTATDNCGAPIVLQFSEVEIPGTCSNQYVITRTWSAQDDCGNATSFVQTITISDTQAPTLVGLPAATVNVTCASNVPVVANVTATDNCGAPIVLQFSEVEIPGLCANKYTITRTWSAQDDCGNATSFVQTITVNDNIPPTWTSALPANTTVQCGEQVLPATLTASDNCGGLVVVESNETLLPGAGPNDGATLTRIWTAYDVCGNTIQHIQVITINDTQAPVLGNLPPATVNVTCSANVPAIAAVTYTDNCLGTVNFDFNESILPGSCVNRFTLVRTWTATDFAGNSTQFVQTINVNDNVAPTWTSALPANVTVQCGEQVQPATLTATDNCGGTVVIDFSETLLPGAGPNDGATLTRTWTAYDLCGNSIQHVQVVSILDTQAPVLSNLPVATVNIECSSLIPAVAAVTVTDNCQGTVDMDYSESILLGNCINQYTLTRTWLATDFAGNTAVFVQTINVNDTQAPVWNQPAPANATVSCASAVPAAPAQTATDNCGVPVITDFSEIVQPGNCLNRFTLVRTWSVQDDCGNATSRQQIITVSDDTAPVMSCPAPLQAQCSPAEQPPYANLTEFTSAGGSASDNCGLNVNSFGLLSETAVGNVFTRTYRVVDQCGNAGTCQQTVTVLDTQVPVFLNCPVGPLVFGNDPDQCSAKINWPAPVAVDNCSIPTVVQTAGPTAGSVVPVGNYTVTFRATDARGNISFCTFQVMVMDTEKPEFDADILMPGDVTVECDAVPAPFVLTNNDVNDNCTPSNLLVITFTEVRTNGNCAFNYTLTRTWRVTDQAGNQLVHTQIVTVRDTKAPTAICKPATVTLDKAGTVSITAAQINNGSFDNCSAQANLTFSVTPSTFTCANLGANTVTLTVTDQCGNSATCTAIVTVLEGIGPCVPQYTVQTICAGPNGTGNATTLDNGQFIDRITVKSLAMQTWTVVSSTGLFLANSPAPPAAPTPLPVGTVFTMGTADGIDNDGNGQIDEANEMVFYTLRGVHVDAVGYTVTIQNNLNQTATISNKAFYPTPFFLNLDGPFCLNTPPFVIQVGEQYNAQGNVVNGSVTINGTANATFNAAQLGVGFHTVMATFDASAAGITTNLVINGVLVGGTVNQSLANPGCQQKITKIVQVVSTPTTIVCNDLVNVSISNDGGNCVFVVTPDNVLEGSYLCDDDYSVVITYPAGTNTYNPANRVDNTHIGKLLNYTLVHSQSGNVCWGKIKVEDKEAPVLTCPTNITIACSDPTAPSFTGQLLISDCSSTTSVVTDDFTDFGSCSNPRAEIVRLWLVTDASGNQSSCTQRITIAAFNLAAVIFPADVTLNCATANSTEPSVTGSPSINGSPIGTGGLCMASISKTDDRYEICPGSYEIVRTWKVRNMCLPISSTNPREHQQVIKVIDTEGPTFDCPVDVTVSTDPFNCCATAPLPSVIITEGCSYVTSLEYRVIGTDFATGNLVIHEGTGFLGDFPGNNYWVPDTLGSFGFTQCLPRGEYDVTYTAIDACGNISKCTFKLFVEDLIPPVAVCDEFTQVALGADGMAFVNAYTFNDGSYDVCESVHFKARRMNTNDCQSNEFFLDQVKFCCSDINDTILVVFRVYDIPVPSGAIDVEAYENHYNDCMVQVYVEDKIKPLCNAPASVTVSCESFDPTLWAYGFATAVDNCCMDTITETRNISLFDTVCNRGTITRTFRAFDCGGNSVTCTQRVFVTYEQDYFVRFPNDVIVTVCDGTGNYGEPTFFGEDCELLGVSHKDDTLTVVPDACYMIERTWSIINWCTYNPNAGCINVPNPNPNPNSQSPANLPGPIVSAAGTPAPWAPTVIAILPGQTPTNYSTFWSANANCYTYKQTIKIIDTQKPIIANCPVSPLDVCDITPNSADLWNAMYWWDNTTGSHDLCEAPTDLTINATDLCSGADVNIRYLLFLDLNGDGDMETVINSTTLPGFNNVNVGNALNPNFSGGTPSQFDFRPVPANQKYGFALQTTTSGTTKTASVRWNTQQQLTTYTIPELPYGTHKIKWIVDDGCGNEQVCEYTFIVKDCKKPTVVCLNGLSVNIMPTKMVSLWDTDFLQYTEDNCTPTNKLVTAIRKAGQGTGFPRNPDNTPQKVVTFNCLELGKQNVELWSIDLAGNADYCLTFVDVQDNSNNCSTTSGTVAGALKTESGSGLEDANVELDGSSPSNPSVNMLVPTDADGKFLFGGVPFAGDYTVTPIKDNDPLNGVSTFDLVLINKHILGIEPLNTPFKMIAADANNSRSITTFDIVELRKLILGIYTELPNNTSWRFVDADFNFPNQLNPFQTIFPETKQIANMQSSMLAEDFTSVKVGDVNGNAVTSSLVNSSDRTEGTLLFDLQDRTVKAGETFTVNFRAAERAVGYQFTLHFPNMEVVDVVPVASEMSMINFGIFNSEHSLTTSFDNDRANGEFAVTFRAKAAGTLSQMLAVSSQITKAEAYSLNRERQSIALRFNGENGSTVAGLGFELYQNQPNPWMNKTQVGFYLPEAAEATLTIFDETGRTLFVQKGEFSKGYNAFGIERALVNTTGVLYYKLETATDSAVKKMIQTK